MRKSINIILILLCFLSSARSQEIHAFAGRGDLEKVKMLLEKDSSLLNKPYILGSPVLWAARYGQIHVIDFLIEKGADINLRHSGITPLFHAAYVGQHTTVDFLLTRGAEIGFFEAVECGYKGLVLKMISEGEDIDQFKEGGYTAFQRAARYGHKDIIDYFINNGLDKNIRDNNGLNLLHNAVFGGHYELVRYLVESGVEINAVTKFGDTPLDFAIDNGSESIIQYLKNKGAESTGEIEYAYEKIRDNVFTFNFLGRPDSNVGLFLYTDGAILIDTGGGCRAAKAVSDFAKINYNKEVKYLINTHIDWDHKRGNAYFRDKLPIFDGLHLDETVKKGIVTEVEHNFENNFELILSRYYTMNLGNEEIIFFPIAGLHTPSCIFIYFRNANVAFTGDTIGSGIPQRESETHEEYVERITRRAKLGGAYHIATLEMLDKTCSDNAICVPGHGNFYNIQSVKEYLAIAKGLNKK